MYNNKVYFDIRYKENYKYILGIDLDGVCWDLTTPWVEALNEKYGTSVKPKDIKGWDMEVYFPTLSRSQIFSPLHQEEFYDCLKLYPDVEENIEKLRDIGVKVLIISSAHYLTIGYKMKTVAKLMNFIDTNDIIITHEKGLINVDGLVDDGYHNLETFSGDRILFTQPHNTKYDLSNCIHQRWNRVNNWEDIVSLISQFVGNNYSMFTNI